MEKIRAYVKAPWIPPLKISISQSKVEAIQRVKSHQGPAVFTDSLSRNDLVGIGVHWQNLNLPDISIAIFLPQYLSVYSGKLAAIDATITYLYYLAQHACLPPLTTIFTDFLSAFQALQALQAPGQQSAQSFLQSINYQVYCIENSFPSSFKIQFAWCPGHSHVFGNEKAHQLAQKSTEKGKSIQSNQHPQCYSRQ